MSFLSLTLSRITIISPSWTRVKTEMCKEEKVLDVPAPPFAHGPRVAKMNDGEGPVTTTGERREHLDALVPPTDLKVQETEMMVVHVNVIQDQEILQDPAPLHAEGIFLGSMTVTTEGGLHGRDLAPLLGTDAAGPRHSDHGGHRLVHGQDSPVHREDAHLLLGIDVHLQGDSGIEVSHVRHYGIADPLLGGILRGMDLRVHVVVVPLGVRVVKISQAFNQVPLILQDMESILVNGRCLHRTLEIINP